MIPHLPTRETESHKGHFGHALIVGGQRGMTGAAVICGLAALRVGAGLVTIATPRSSQSIVASASPVYMTLGLKWKKPACEIRKQLETSRYSLCVLAIGPGMGRRTNTDQLVMELFEHWSNLMILDADALNALASCGLEWFRHLRSSQNLPPRILTPHPKEWQRISGVDSSDRQAQIRSAQEFALSCQVVVVLKGSKTIVTDGLRTYENQSGNPSLAVGGSGDCLTGMITGLACQGLLPFEAAVLGVYLHGLAADLAHEQLKTPSTLPNELLEYLPAAFQLYRQSQVVNH